MKISVFIIAKNEEPRIVKAIESVKAFADEIIVIDSGSTDKTVSVAEAAGARVLFNAWNGYGLQKRFGEDACKNDWIFNLDADERVMPALVTEIKHKMADNTLGTKNFWRVDIRDQYPHETKPACFAFSHRQIRLYNKKVGRFSDSTVHDTVRPPEGADIGFLKGDMAHESFVSIAASLDKINRYSTMQADDMARAGRRISMWRIVADVPVSFLKAYVLRRYALYGGWGFILAFNYAYIRHLRLAKRYEMQIKPASA